MARAADIVASLAHCRLKERLTTWRALWLTDRHLVFGEASKATEGWSAHSDDRDGSDPAPDSFVAWATPLRAVVALEMPAQTVARVHSHSEDGRAWADKGHARVVLGHGEKVSLPLFPEDNDVDVEAAVVMIAALADRL